MPEKDGADDKKTTKSVVNKKQKQMMGEEGYDRYRDRILMRGGDHRSDETKNRSYTPTGKQPKGKTVLQKQTEKKYGKGKSALDIVKADITAKYGKGAIMNVKKEELDLTPVAESFGGHIVEVAQTLIKKGLEKGAQKTLEKGAKSVIVATGRNLPKNNIRPTGRTFKTFQDKVKTVTPEIVKSTPFDKKTSAITKVAPKELAKIKPKTSTLVRGGVKQDAITTATDTAIDKISNRRPPTTGEKQPPSKTKSEKDKPSDGVQLHLGRGGKSSFVMAG